MRWRQLGLAMTSATAALLLTGCHVDMWTQNKVKPNQANEFFSNGQGNRPYPLHTIARGHLRLDDARYLGYVQTGPKPTDIAYTETFPFPIKKEDLERGRDRYNIYCSPCHGQTGTGQGFIAQRGLAQRRQPGNFHSDRLRRMPIGHFYDVISNGFGAMYPYAGRIESDDRWRIVAYLRALQISQNADTASLTPDEIKKIEKAGATSTAQALTPAEQAQVMAESRRAQANATERSEPIQR